MPKMMKQLDLRGFTGNPMFGYVWTNLLAGIKKDCNILSVKCIKKK